MITKEHLAIYNHFNGDIDGFTILSRPEERKLMDSDVWHSIEYFLSTLKPIQRGLASKEFSKRITDELQVNCDSETTIEQLKILSIK